MSKQNSSKQVFAVLLSYLNNLYLTGAISEEAYKELVEQAVTAFAKAMVMHKLRASLKKYEFYLDEIVQPQ